MSGVIGAVLGGVFAAVLFGFVEGWTYSTGFGFSVYHHFNGIGIVWVVIGMIGGAIIGIFGKKLLTAIKAPKLEQLSGADEIRKLKDLLDSGVITEEEFNQQKSKILNDFDSTQH